MHGNRAVQVQPAEEARTRRRLVVERDLLAANDELARTTREELSSRGVLALNLMSSPGAGKTTLLVKTIEALHGRLAVAVIEGDQQTSRDAERIREAGAPAIQINTGQGCHLEASTVRRAIGALGATGGTVLFIENIGNLVCPAMFDLGETARVVILSTTEGDDKPLKYPHMFRAADLLLINKVDLLAHLDFDLEMCVDFARRVNPGLEVLCVSARSGEGLAAWFDWIHRARERVMAGAAVGGGNGS